jgi:hypothetical protein
VEIWGGAGPPHGFVWKVGEWSLLGRVGGGWKVVCAGRKNQTGWKAAAIARGWRGCHTGQETASADLSACDIYDYDMNMMYECVCVRERESE